MMMSAASSIQSLRLSSTLKMEEEAINMKKQGIGSILGTDSETSKASSSSSSSSLRRTLSADMSSTKWLARHGFSPMKKIASTEDFAASSSSIATDSEDEEEDCSDEPESQFDIWSSIISQKEEILPPYIHPLVKRAASSLSEKSLQICTESLGSETGSDGFSSETGTDDVEEEDREIERERQPQQESFDYGEGAIHIIPKYNYVVGKKSSSNSFPPPIPSLSRCGGASIRMQCLRDKGRLVLEAVSVPTANNFCAQRRDGRLLLTFIDANSTEQEPPKNYEEDEEEEDMFDNFEEEEKDGEDDEEEEDDEEIEFVMEKAPKLSSRVLNLHRLTLMVKNKNPTWSNKFNEVVRFDDGEEELDHQPTMVAQSLPPPPRMSRLIPKPPVNAAASTATTTTTTMAMKVAASATAGAASFNAYEYFWRPKPAMAESKGKNYEQKKELVVLRGDNLVTPLLKSISSSCKERRRRSLLLMEPHCIATS